MKKRDWRTRPDPFEEVWGSELVPLLEAHPSVQGITLLEALQERYPGGYPDKLLRTLQRRVKHWRALYGQDKERHLPGRLGLSDFTELKGMRSRSEAKSCPIGCITSDLPIVVGVMSRSY